MTSEDPEEAGVEQAEVAFSKGDLQGSSVWLTVFGKKDLKREGQTEFSIRAMCSSADKRFDTATITASAFVMDWHFPRMLKIFPVTVSEHQTMAVTSTDFDNGHNDGQIQQRSQTEMDVVLGGVVVSQPPVMRTMALGFNNSDELWEVDIDDDRVRAWEESASAAYWRDSKREIVPLRRREEGVPEGVPQTMVTPTKDRATWYPWWLTYEKELRSQGAHIPFRVSDGYDGLPVFNSTIRLNLSTHQGPVLPLANASSFRRLRLAAPGPLPSRRVLSVAQVAFNGLSVTIVREYAQRYNFSRDLSTVSFVAPAASDLSLEAGGSVDMSVRWASGMIANATGVVMYSKCPSGEAFGFFGDDCRCHGHMGC